MGKLDGKEQEIIGKYLGGLSMPQLALIYGVAHQSIDKLLKKNKVQKRSKKESLSIRFANYSKVSNELLEKINGWLLGDGSVYWRDSSQASFEHGSKHFEYVEYIKNCFAKENIKCNVRKIFSKKAKTYFWLLTTQRTIQFKELRDKWYPLGIKIIPQDLKITPSVMKFWIMDDGSLDKIDNILSLHTCAFKTEECHKLIEKIKYCFGEIKASVILDGRQYSRININRLSYNKIIDIMNDIEVNCFQYKFNKKVCKKDRNIKEL